MTRREFVIREAGRHWESAWRTLTNSPVANCHYEMAARIERNESDGVRAVAAECVRIAVALADALELRDDAEGGA